MTKKAQAEMGIGIAVLIGILVLGAFGSHKALSENRYILDASTNEIYDLSKCSISHLDQSNLEYIDIREVKDNEQYKIAEC